MLKDRIQFKEKNDSGIYTLFFTKNNSLILITGEGKDYITTKSSVEHKFKTKQYRSLNKTKPLENIKSSYEGVTFKDKFDPWFTYTIIDVIETYGFIQGLYKDNTTPVYPYSLENIKYNFKHNYWKIINN